MKAKKAIFFILMFTLVVTMVGCAGEGELAPEEYEEVYFEEDDEVEEVIEELPYEEEYEEEPEEEIIEEVIEEEAQEQEEEPYCEEEAAIAQAAIYQYLEDNAEGQTFLRETMLELMGEGGDFLVIVDGFSLTYVQVHGHLSSGIMTPEMIEISLELQDDARRTILQGIRAETGISRISLTVEHRDVEGNYLASRTWN